MISQHFDTGNFKLERGFVLVVVLMQFLPVASDDHAGSAIAKSNQRLRNHRRSNS
jgi:hypothetical protein